MTVVFVYNAAVGLCLSFQVRGDAHALPDREAGNLAMVIVGGHFELPNLCALRLYSF